MSNTPTDEGTDNGQDTQERSDRLVYVMPQQMSGARTDDEVDLLALWNIVWRGKILVAVVTILFAVGSVLFALAQTEWYRAEVLLAPAEERSSTAVGGQLGGLAALAGVSVGGEGEVAEAMATLRSREFARAFIDENQLIQVFFADAWNEAASSWRAEDSSLWPDVRDAVIYFHEKVLEVSKDHQSGLVTLAIEWTDPEVAAIWADDLVRRLNARQRERALRTAEVNVAYLQAELAQTSVVTLQQSIGRLLESEMQKLMLARGNEEFAFRIIDGAEPPKYRVRPKRTQIAVLGTLLGGMIGVLIVCITYMVRRGLERNSST